MKKLKTLQSLIYVSIVLIIAQSLLIFNFNNSTVAHMSPTSAIRVTVVDINGMPLSKAKVCVVEINKFFFTDDKGLSPIITIPIVNSPLNIAKQSNWYPVTILIYCDKYIDTVLYNCVVYKDRIRVGPTIRLLKKDSSSPPFIALVENPPDLFTLELLESYR